jgi:FkbM family methyltransferase
LPSSLDLMDRVLRAVLLSREVFSEEDVDTRYPPFGYGSAPEAVVGEHVRYFRFFLDHAARFEWAIHRLEDEKSRELLCSLILFRILGYRRAKVDIDREALEKARAQSATVPSTPSLVDIPMTPSLRHYEIPAGASIRYIDCLQANVFFSFFHKQYFFERDRVNISPGPGDVAIDAGACFGDTAICFADAVGSEGRVCSFEVLSPHLKIIRYNLDQNPELTNVALYPFALGECNREGVLAEGPPNPGYSLIGAQPGVSVRTLDSLVDEGEIRTVDFVKMDIEGSELAALRGAVHTIRRFRPRLAISIYHKWDDYWTIPEFIESLGLPYRFYLANYTLSDGETILYATCAS